MPYIHEEVVNCVKDEEMFNEVVDTVISHIRILPPGNQEGACNYAISRIVAGSLRPGNGWIYSNLNKAHGTFLSAAAEFYRRLIAPYEDKCIERNGDLPEYKDN